MAKTPRLAETGLPKGRDEGPRGQMVRLRLRSVCAGLAVFWHFVHYEEGARRGPVRGVGTLLLAGVADSRLPNAHAEIRARPPDEWVP